MNRPLLLAFLLCTPALAAQAQDIVAQRGQIRLTASDVRDLVARVPPAQRAQLQSNPAAVTELVRNRLLRQSLLAEAKAKNWDQMPDVAAKAADARDDVIVTTYLASMGTPDPAFPSEAEVQAVYDANRTSLARPKQYQLAHIVLLSPLGNPQDEDVRKRLAALRLQAVRPRADFADLARKNSQDRATAEKGGDLGWIREDQLLPVVKDAVSGLQEGGVSEPVRTADGWHMFKLAAIRPPAPLPLTEVRDQLVQAMRQERSQQLTKAALDEQLRRDPIQINEIGLQSAIAK